MLPAARMKMGVRRDPITTAVLCMSLTFLLLAFVHAGVPKLKHYNIDKDQISISGFSSGGFFAVQFHVAFSKLIMGAGIMAGGPFWCAKDNFTIAMSVCLNYTDTISVDELVGVTYSYALSGKIDSPSNLKNDRVYLFSGLLDSVVHSEVVKSLKEYYEKFVSTWNIYSEFSLSAEHSMVTDDYGNDCEVRKRPFINKCNYSAAYHLLQHIYSNIHPVNSSQAIHDNLFEFSQAEFFMDLPSCVSMDSVGYVYVPSACQSGEKICRLHVVFHGCLQGRVFISDKFARHSGYNAIAEVNNIIILYPQVWNSSVPSNSLGCWDWTGFTGSSYASKLGPQIAGVKLMVDRISGTLS